MTFCSRCGIDAEDSYRFRDRRKILIMDIMHQENCESFIKLYYYHNVIIFDNVILTIVLNNNNNFDLK